MRIEKDFEELLKLFNRNKVRYCVIGSYALALYGVPRYTKDMDLLVEPDSDNAKRVMKALGEFGFGLKDLTEHDLCKKKVVIQLGYEPVRIDLATSIDGVTFAEAWKGKKRAKFGRLQVSFIGLKELIKNKKRTARQQDKIDIDSLKRLKK